MHQPIEERLKHPADFRVKYRFYSEEEGGRIKRPHQGYRSDFWYGNECNDLTRVYMIWPEFEDRDGNVILDNDKPVPSTGTAMMWIIFPQTREYHRGKIQLDLKGYFMEGPRKVAVCEVIELLGLYSNPTE